MSNQKKPSYLYEVFDSASEEEEAQLPSSEEQEKSSYSVFICKEIEHQPKCFLCGNLLKLCFDLTEHVEGSEHTLSDVLAKLFSRERLPASLARKDYSQGLLCTDCRDLLKDLFRLQRELKTVKNEVVRIFRNSENNDMEDISTDESDPEPVSAKKRIKLVKKTSSDSTEKENVKVFNNQKRKRDCKGISEVKCIRKKDSGVKEKKSSNTQKRKRNSVKKTDDINSISSHREEGLLFQKQLKYLNTVNQDETNVGSNNKRKEGSKKIRKTDKSTNLDIIENIKSHLSEIMEEDNSSGERNTLSVDKQASDNRKTSNENTDETNEKRSYNIKDEKENRDTIETGGKGDMKTYIKELDDDIFDDIDILLDEYSTAAKTHEIETKESSQFLEEVSIDRSVSENSAKQNSNESFVPDGTSPKVKKRKEISSQKGYNNKKDKLLNDSKTEKAFYDLYVLDEYMNVDNKSNEKKTTDNYKATNTDKEETTENDTPKVSDEKDTPDKSVDDVYNIESLVAKKGSTYLVKWENYPEDQNTWEPQCSIPESVLQFYESDISRLGKPIPTHFIKNDEYDSYDDPDDDNWKPAKDKKANKVLVKKNTSSLKDMAKEKIKTGQKNTKTQKKIKTNAKEEEILMQEDKNLTNEDVENVGNDENAKTIELLLARNGWKYFVKWKNLPNEENSWEHWTAIPKRILNYYQRDLSRLGSSPFLYRNKKNIV